MNEWRRREKTPSEEDAQFEWRSLAPSLAAAHALVRVTLQMSSCKKCEMLRGAHTLYQKSPRAFSSLTQLTAQMYTQYGAETRDRVYLHCDV
jgi:hypothetical protein